MQKIRKILGAVSEKTALPIITNNTDLIGPRWRRSNKPRDAENEGAKYKKIYRTHVDGIAEWRVILF